MTCLLCFIVFIKKDWKLNFSLHLIDLQAGKDEILTMQERKFVTKKSFKDNVFSIFFSRPASLPSIVEYCRAFPSIAKPWVYWWAGFVAGFWLFTKFYFSALWMFLFTFLGFGTSFHIKEEKRSSKLKCSMAWSEENIAENDMLNISEELKGEKHCYYFNLKLFYAPILKCFRNCHI